MVYTHTFTHMDRIANGITENHAALTMRSFLCSRLDAAPRLSYPFNVHFMFVIFEKGKYAKFPHQQQQNELMRYRGIKWHECE